MKQGYILFITVVTALLLMTSCRKVEFKSLDSDSELITYMPRIAGQSADTRGSMITGTEYDYSKLGSFWVKVWNKDDLSPQFEYTEVRQFTHEAGTQHTYWSTVDGSGKLKEYFWKKVGSDPETKYFYAYTNLPETGAAVTSGDWCSQNLQYNVSEVQNASNQTDILLGWANGTTGTTKDGYVGRFAQIKFTHPLTAIRFKEGTIEGFAAGDKIKDIQIVGVYSSGTYHYNKDSGSSWTPSSDVTTVTMSDTTETFFLVPQDLATKSIIVKATIVLGGSSYNVQGTVSTGNWQVGHYYTYSLSYSVGMSLELSVNIANWGKNDKDLEISSDFVLGYDPAVDPWKDADDTHLTYTD